jgi:mono/diheme cytochrome c family protein
MVTVAVTLMLVLAACGSGASSNSTASAGTAGMGPGMMTPGGAPRMMGRGSGVPPPTVTIAPTVASSQSAPVSFSRDILPILTSQCGSCHGGQGGLWLTTYEQVMVGGQSGAVVVPGQSSQSLLYLRVSGDKPPQMPLDAAPLTQNQIDAIRKWIDEGAPKN